MANINDLLGLEQSNLRLMKFRYKKMQTNRESNCSTSHVIILYMKIRQQVLLPQLKYNFTEFIFQLNGAPPHLNNLVRREVNY